MTEKELKRKIKSFLRNKGYFVKYYSGMGMGQAGVPDILGSYKGKFIAIEVKREGNKPTRLQAYNIKMIREKGKGIAFVCYGWEDFKKKWKKEVENNGSL